MALLLPVLDDAGRRRIDFAAVVRRLAALRAWLASRLVARTGVRLALVQAVAVIIAFAVAGGVAQVAVRLIDQRAVQERVLGEAVSLQDEFVIKGSDHLPYTVNKRSRLWRGFEYRLVGPDGTLRAGRLPPVPAAEGWSKVRDRNADGRSREFLVYSEPLPDGSQMSVGQDLASEERQLAAVRRTLALCGVLGVALCLLASYAFARGVWRRVAAVVAAAHQVSLGRLDVRVAVRSGAPRDDVDELGGAFNVMLEEIGALVGQVRQVSTDIAHYLRTPLTRVSQRLDRLRRASSGNPELLASVERIDADIEEILRTFDSMLRLAEIENGRGMAGPVVADLADIASQVGEAYRPDLEAEGRRFDLRLSPAPVAGDTQLLAQAISNLLENVMRHTPAGTPVRLTVEARDGAAALRVEDGGEGIAPKDHDVVLQRFRRLDPSRSGPGSGLGLPIIAAIARRHGATLGLGDAGPGLRVELVFPAPPRAASPRPEGA